MVKTNGLRRQKTKSWIFYIGLVILPLTQFMIFYVGVNLNSILLSFKVYGTESVRISLDNFRRIFSAADFPTVVNSLKNSAVAFSARVLIGMTGGLFFSYYIFKKMFAHTFFKVMLFLPTIVSSVVMVIIFRLFVEELMPFVLTGNRYAWGLLSQDSTKFGTVLFYNIWVGFGTQVLMYLSAMNNISEGALEACSIDGANFLQEFIYIVFPGIYPTFIVFVVVNLVEFFTNQMALHAFFGFKELGNTKFFTLGYYMYREVGLANGNYANLTYPAALGVMCTLIAIPFTLAVRRLLTKFGPSES